MPPGGETSRYSGRFGENVLPHGSHEWLPYSKDEVLLKCSNTNLPDSRTLLTIILNHPGRGYRNRPLSTQEKPKFTWAGTRTAPPGWA